MPPTRELDFERLDEGTMRARADDFCRAMSRRRSVRAFSPAAIPLDVVRRCIEAAHQAPSGANKQPWTFVLVTDPDTKGRIRTAAEEQERSFYEERAPDRWLDDLTPLGTDAHKPFLESAPALIAVFAQRHGPGEGERHYYVQESVGFAVGILLAGLHLAGLATLTYTPRPMTFLGEILERPSHERPYVLVPVGYPAEGCEVPDIERKPLSAALVER